MIGIDHLSPRSVGGVTIAQCVALIAPLAVVATADPERFALNLVAALVAALVWEGIFATLRRRVLSFHGVTTAFIVAVVLPPEIAIWQIVFAVSLGVILGELVFGGRGFGFVQPAAVALSLLLISFPELQLRQSTTALAVATVPGAVLLLLMGLISWRVLVGAIIASAVLLALRGAEMEPVTVATAMAFALVFLVCDPISAAATPIGRWIYGALAGGLVIVFSPPGAPTAEAMVFAALMASVFAPLIDHVVILIHARREMRRHA